MSEVEMRSVVLQAIAQVAPEVDTSSIDAGEDLQEQLDLDSMDFLNVIVAIDQRTGIEIPERDYPKLTTLDGASAYLAAAQATGT